ncbi:MAG: AraC family transcriptional regulator [Hungatella sp.]|jgi:AraC-like DNA-binding protein|nr:AraC family transcriptional regulator [Hungatella sp.]
MKPYHNSPLLYEKGFSIIINDMAMPMENSTLYYFDYDQRSQSVNMEFPHFHIFYEMMILLSPKAYHFVEGKRYDMVSNDIILLPPSILHQSVYLPGPPSDRIVIGFMLPKQMTEQKPGYREILSIFNCATPIFRFHREEQHMIFDRLNEIITLQLSVHNPQVRELMIHNKFIEFLFMLYSLRHRNHYVLNVEDTGIREKIYTITNYIHTHYSDDISLSSLADTFYISPYYLSHQFKAVTGYTVVQYIQLTRIKNAQYLLLNSKDKITRIAEQTGFSSFSQFNRVFRKFCGMSPSDYKITSHQTSYAMALPSKEM